MIVQNFLEGKGAIVTPLSASKNLNTIYFYLKSMPSDLSLALFDINGIELSQGSACSSGSSKESQYMLHMNLPNYARHGLRLSHGPLITQEDIQGIKKYFEVIFSKIK